MDWTTVGCHFLSGSSPSEAHTRLLLFAAACMLRDGRDRITFRFGEDDFAGECGISTRGEYVLIGCYGGIKCDVVMEAGTRRYEACVLVTPRYDPGRFLDPSGRLVSLPPEMYYPDGVSVAEA